MQIKEETGASERYEESGARKGVGRRGLSLQELAKVCLGSKSAEEQLVELQLLRTRLCGLSNSEKG